MMLSSRAVHRPVCIFCQHRSVPLRLRYVQRAPLSTTRQCYVRTRLQGEPPLNKTRAVRKGNGLTHRPLKSVQGTKEDMEKRPNRIERRKRQEKRYPRDTAETGRRNRRKSRREKGSTEDVEARPKGVERQNQGERPMQAERPDQAERSYQAERPNQVERPYQAERRNQVERPYQAERPNQVESPHRVATQNEGEGRNKREARNGGTIVEAGKPKRRRSRLEIGSTENSRDETVEDTRLYELRGRRDALTAFQKAVDEAPEHLDYVPATTWDGMEMVGGEKEWDRGVVFEGFKPTKRLEEPEEITAAIHRAVVEVFAALAAGRSLKNVCQLETGPLVNPTKDVRMAPTSDGRGATMSFPNEHVRRAVLHPNSQKVKATIVNVPGVDELPTASPEVNGDEEAETNKGIELSSEVQADDTSFNSRDSTPGTNTMAVDYTLKSLKADITSWGRDWLHVSLNDPDVKFTVVKRVLQLSGLTIPDPTIHRADSVGDLVSDLAKPKPPQSLFEVLVTNHGLVDFGGRDKRVDQGALQQLVSSGLAKQLIGLPNVKVMGRRETPVDKEKVVGRWKVIEQELRRRDLPVLGQR